MKRLVCVALVWGAAASLAGPAAAQEPRAPDVDPVVAPSRMPAQVRLEDLAWLAGSWAGEVKGAGATTRFETRYTSPEGGVILSMSKALTAPGRLSWFEFERFELLEGTLRVTPYPGGRAGVSFDLVEYDPAAKRAVFANPEHDYPTRITYHRAAEDRLILVVAGETAEAPVMEFVLTRQR
jgi:hypothetical protein